MSRDSIFAKDGRTVLLPIDHGTAIPVPNMKPLGTLIPAVSEFVDGFVVNYGVGHAFASQLNGKKNCLRIDVYKPDTTAGSFRVFGADEAEELGAGSMMHMLYPGHPNEEDITRECCEAIVEGYETGIPVIVEALPVGLGQTEHYTADKIGFAARQAAELGAAVVKTVYPAGTSAREFARIIEGCFVPVIILGGAALGDDEALLTMVAQSLEAGASGVAIGRNVWQHPQPARIAQQIAALVHEGVTVDDALKLGV